MSYILDALKRAEQERSSGLTGSPDAAIAHGSRARVRPLTLAMAGATIFLAGIGVAALLFRTPGQDPHIARTALPEATLAPAVASTPVPSTPAPVAAPAAQEPPQSGTIEADTSADTPLLDDYQSLDDIAPVFQGTAVADAAVPGATPAADAAPDPAPAAPSSPAATSTQAPTRMLPPMLDDMPADFRARFPQLQLQVHVHDADPAKRWVMIDNRRYDEGGRLDSGPRIAEIAADGVIFELEGQRTFWPLAR